jgi:hypothetical protein
VHAQAFRFAGNVIALLAQGRELLDQTRHDDGCGEQVDPAAFMLSSPREARSIGLRRVCNNSSCRSTSKAICTRSRENEAIV